MFKWLRKQRIQRAAAQEERCRQIFEYQTRDGTRYCDPLLVAMALETDPNYTDDHLARAKRHDPVSLEVVANAAVRAFNVQRLNQDGEGATVAELIGLVDAFDLWCFQLQKKT